MRRRSRSRLVEQGRSRGITNVVLQSIHFSDPFRGSFSAVSTPIFASKVAFFSVFRALHFFLCTIPDFSDFSGPLHHFSQNLTQFSLNFKRDSRFCKSLSKFHRFFSEFLRNFSDFDRIDVKMMIFRKNQRKIAEIIKKYVAKILKICLKKCIL